MFPWSDRLRILHPLHPTAVVTALLVWFLLSPAVSLTTQRGGGVLVAFVIMLEGEREPYNKPVTVTLRDGWGNVEGAASTDKGYIQLIANGGGVHRLVIAGPEIEMYDEEFTLDATTELTRTVVVQPRPLVTNATSSKPGEAVSASRLQAPKRAVKEFQKAQDASRKNNRPEAEEHLRRAIRLYPRYDDAFSSLGDLELQDGNREAALRDLATALQLNPNHADAAHQLGQIRVAEAKYAEAEPMLQVWLRSHPGDAWALSYAALGQLTQGKFELAAASAQKVHSLPHQEFASAHLIAGRALEHLRHWDDAAAEYRLYLSEAPNGPNAEQAHTSLMRLAGTPQDRAQP